MLHWRGLLDWIRDRGQTLGIGELGEETRWERRMFRVLDSVADDVDLAWCLSFTYSFEKMQCRNMFYDLTLFQVFTCA